MLHLLAGLLPGYVLLIQSITPVQPARTAKLRPRFVNQYPGISAHRGASNNAPENTLATYRAVLAMAVNYIEIDVRTTADNQLVILHDGTLDRTTNGTGPMRNQTLTELKKLSVTKGYGKHFRTERIPTLAEVCQLISDWNACHSSKTNVYVDCKDVAPEPLVACLSNYGLLDGAVFYGSDNYLSALYKTEPKARLMPSLKNAADLPSKISTLHPYAVDINCSILTEDLVCRVHQQGIKVFSDLLDQCDTPDQYSKATRLGIDVIQTDHVLRVRQALSEEPKKE